MINHLLISILWLALKQVNKKMYPFCFTETYASNVCCSGTQCYDYDSIVEDIFKCRKSIDQHVINDVRLCALKTTNDLNNSNIKIEPSHFDPIFIIEYNKSDTNFSEVK